MKEVAICDNNGFVISPLEVCAVNKHDTELFPHSFDNLVDTADLLDLDIQGSYVTLDPGFDSIRNTWLIDFHKLVPVIKPNRRGTKNPRLLNAKLDGFEEVKHIYRERYKIERTFAWQDTYRKLVVRYEKLQCTHLGFKHLAYSMINLRGFFNR